MSMGNNLLNDSRVSGGKRDMVETYHYPTPQSGKTLVLGCLMRSGVSGDTGMTGQGIDRAFDRKRNPTGIFTRKFQVNFIDTLTHFVP